MISARLHTGNIKQLYSGRMTVVADAMLKHLTGQARHNIKKKVVKWKMKMNIHEHR